MIDLVQQVPLEDCLEKQMLCEARMSDFRNSVYTLALSHELNSFSHWIYANISPLLVLLYQQEDSLPISPLPLNNKFGYYKSLQDDRYELIPHSETLRLERISNQKFSAKSKKKCYYMFLGLIAKVNLIEKITIVSNQDFCLSTNELMQSYLGRNPYPVLNNDELFPTNPKDFTLKIKSKKFIRFRDELFDLVAQYCIENSLLFSKYSLLSLINFIACKLETDIFRFQTKSLNFLGKIHTSSGGSYGSMLFGHVKSFHKYTLSRYEHGGERCFFNDHEFWRYELSGCDEYFTYSTAIADNYRKAHPETNIFHCRSNYYGVKCNPSISTKIKSNALLVGVSYVGEAIQVMRQKSLDINQFILESQIIQIIRKLGWNFRYKPHPKGFAREFFKQNFDNEEIEDRSISTCLDQYSHVIVTYFGSAAIESLLQGKSLMYIDTGIRPHSPLFHELKSVIYYYTLVQSKNCQLELNHAVQDFMEWNVDISRLSQFHQKFYAS